MSTQTIEIMQNGIARLKLAAYSPDMVITVPRDLCQFWEFDRAAEMIEIGYDKAGEAIMQYQKQRRQSSKQSARNHAASSGDGGDESSS